MDDWKIRCSRKTPFRQTSQKTWSNSIDDTIGQFIVDCNCLTPCIEYQQPRLKVTTKDATNAVIPLR